MKQESTLKQLTEQLLAKRAEDSGVPSDLPADGVKAETLPTPDAATKSPEADAVINGDTAGNEGHTLPGGNSQVGDVPADPDTEGVTGVANVATNDDPENKEVAEIEKATEVVIKSASAVAERARQIAALGAEAAVSLHKFASGEASLEEELGVVDNFIQKRAALGDPFYGGLQKIAAAYQYGLRKKAEDIQAMLEEDPTLDPAIADAALTSAAEEAPEDLLADAGMIDAAEVDDMDAEAADDAAAEALVEEAGDLEAAVAEAIMADNPEVPPEAAQEAAAEIVGDAVESVAAAHDVGEVDADGVPTLDDDEAAEVAEDLDKTAAANPYREGAMARLIEGVQARCPGWGFGAGIGRLF